ncbi:helix-turn-helix transcriptional regulator [Ignatzschineria rhizosphaerae]|uniref:Helix-turn-helix transcriptional regulator n=1 Tax=Ignatzschineria rhizosphaerae TaxID=2923279 RepID=A0ABY3X1K2_9GAMM|nr:helix-turn-helix transcriptional regulator [Ignatzschineria rhizosphaerae]UNM95569.1 helix-turn-helix transcriptional regulator [Ignatzschineria rhizosphaerae]
MAWIESDAKFDADKMMQPIIGIASKLVRHDSGLHQHQKGQFLFSEKGAMTIILGDSMSVLPPQRLAWIPPGLIHRVQLREVVNYRSIYIDASIFTHLPKGHTIWHVTPLLRAVLEMIALSDWDTNWELGTRENHWLQVLWDELTFGKTENIQLPLPEDYRFQKLNFSALPPELKELTKIVGASEKTITRIFQKETGLGYQAWRQQWRLLKAIELLSDELPLMDIAIELGFSNDSAFAQFFKRMTGKTPKQYL